MLEKLDHRLRWLPGYSRMCGTVVLILHKEG